MTQPADTLPASTVVLLRDAQDGLETLLLRRNKALMFAGGFWVFPGGALDKEDLAAANGDIVEAARLAAGREALEESGLQPREEDMVALSHWTTPEIEPRRFSTWFFAAPLKQEGEVVIDGGEIHDSRWISVREAISLHQKGELGLLPPTFVSLLNLARYENLEQMLQEERSTPAPELMPVIGDDDGALVVMFPGDAGYASGDAAATGARHRVTLNDQQWSYAYEGEPDFPCLAGQRSLKND